MQVKIAILLTSLVIAPVSLLYFTTNKAIISPSDLSWGPVQSGTVRDISDNGKTLLIAVIESSGAITWFKTTTGCGSFYHPGDTVSFRFSSYDPSIQTQRSQLVSAPQDCSAISPV